MRGWMGKFRSLFLFGAMTMLLAGCGVENISALKPKGYGSELLFDLMLISIAIMIFVFVIVMAIYAFVLIRYRAKKGQEHIIPKQTEGNKALEVIWTVIPIILLLVLAIPTVQATFDLADQSTQGDEGVLTVDVTGNQYWWQFDYSEEEISTSQELYIPTNERVYLNMKSSDVIHSFWVPAIAGKMDTNPGENMNTMYLEAYEEGVYEGFCAELCGPSHSLMYFKVVAVSPDEYDQWVEDMQSIDPEETVSAKDGQKLFQDNCMSCHAIGGASAGVGPNLGNFANREKIAGILQPTKENLVDWIVHPDEIKEGNQMPAELVNRDEAEKIADYLLELDHSDVGKDLEMQSVEE